MPPHSTTVLNSAAWPSRFDDEDHLEDFMTTPSPALTAALHDIPGDLMVLGIGGKIQLPYLAVNVAQYRGYFKEEGLTVNYNEFQSGPDSLKALVGGSVDFVSGAYEHTLYLQARGQFITSIALQNNSFGSLS